MIRAPAVSGRFYSGDPSQLAEQVDEMLLEAGTGAKALARGCLAPHAAYQYSGRVAGAVYGRLQIPGSVIVIGPRHHLRGVPLALLAEGEWQTPLGRVPVNRSLAQKLMRASPSLQQDERAHRSEHSVEVQLPILQRLQPALAFVPIVIGAVNYEELETLGKAVARVISAEREPILLVASSDLNHYEPEAITRAKDCKALACMLALDPRGLFETVGKERISMCGWAAAVVMLAALQEFGAARAELVRHTTSGEINGDLQEVVGYAGMIFG